MMLKEKYTEPTDIYLNFKNRYDGVPIKYCENRISDSFVNKYAKLFWIFVNVINLLNH